MKLAKNRTTGVAFEAQYTLRESRWCSESPFCRKFLVHEKGVSKFFPNAEKFLKRGSMLFPIILFFFAKHFTLNFSCLVDPKTMNLIQRRSFDFIVCMFLSTGW